MNLRSATPDDVPTLAALDIAAKRAAMPTIAWPRSEAEIRWYIGERLLPTGGVVVAETAGEIVGYMATEPGWIEQLYLKQTVWRQGIGSALMARAKSENPGGLRLYCFQVNARGRAFYERHGFVVETLGDGSKNEEGEPDILYVWNPKGFGKPSIASISKYIKSKREPTMPQPTHISALGVPDAATLPEDLKLIWAKCEEKLGFVPNVYATLSLKPQRLRDFMQMFNEIMLSDSALSKLEREMVAVVVSSVNRCYYCLISHGAAVRKLSGDPQLGEMLSLNYRAAPLDARQRAMLDFAWKLTATPAEVVESDRNALRAAGFDNETIFDLAQVIGLFNLSNRMAIASDMMPNAEYHTLARG